MRAVPIFFIMLLLGTSGAQATPRITMEAESLAYEGQDTLCKGENVEVVFEDQSKLSCRFADFSYRDLKGVFREGIHNQTHVLYTGVIVDDHGKQFPLTVSGLEMHVLMTGEQNCYVREIGVDRDVSIHYQDTLTAYSDRAIYRSWIPEDIKSDKMIPSDGVIELLGGDSGCLVIDSMGGEIISPHIMIFPSRRQIRFEQPQGHLLTPKEKAQHVDFNAKQLIWQDDAGILALKDDVEVTLEGFGKLTAQDIELKQSQSAPKQLQTCVCTGETQLTYVDETKGLSHTLTAYGCVTVDHEGQKVRMESPRGENGEVQKGHQVTFQDYMGTIYADEVTIEYRMNNQRLMPHHLQLEGHVQIRNQFSSDASVTTPLEQYALADIVTYDPTTRVMTLSAYPKKRVLFFDKINHIQVSAPSLTVTRDPKTRKESFQGKGDVRFLFVDEEVERLRYQFGDRAQPDVTPESVSPPKKQGSKSSKRMR